MNIWPLRRRTGKPSDDAIAADREATRALRDAQALTNRVDEVVDRLAKTRERNHFADAVYRALGRGV